MTKTKQFLSGLVLTLAATAASATIIDFKTLANQSERGEQDYSPVAGVTINGYYDDGSGKSKVYAYLDKGWGGLGVCKNIDANKQCQPGNDDNTTEGENLNFVFDSDVIITKIWFNNNHDPDKSLLGDTINIGGGVGDFTFGLADQTNVTGNNSNWLYSGVINVAAGADFDLTYVDEEFYVTAIQYHVPEPAILGLLALGLIGIGVTKRRKA